MDQQRSLLQQSPSHLRRVPLHLQVRLTKGQVPSLPLGTTIYISSAPADPTKLAAGHVTSTTAGRRRRQLML